VARLVIDYRNDTEGTDSEREREMYARDVVRQVPRADMFLM
jgi:hypothetical protein